MLSLLRICCFSLLGYAATLYGIALSDILLVKPSYFFLVAYLCLACMYISLEMCAHTFVCVRKKEGICTLQVLIIYVYV